MVGAISDHTYRPMHIQEEMAFTHIEASFAFRVFRLEFGLHRNTNVVKCVCALIQVIILRSVDTYRYQLVSVIMTYRVARANIRWKKLQLYATFSSSLSQTLASFPPSASGLRPSTVV